VKLPLEALYVFGTTHEGRAVGLVGDVALEDLVHYLEVMLVADLLGVTSVDGLVLFSGGHVSLSFPIPRFHFRKGCSITEKLPAKEAWRIPGEGLFTGLRGRGFSEVAPILVSHQTSPVVQRSGADESHPSWGRGCPCSTSREEFAHGEQQTC
jgi:hypothetical protein